MRISDWGSDVCASDLTAVRQAAEQAGILGGGGEAQVRADLAASFQAAVGDTLADRCAKALMVFQEDYGAAGPLVVAGGVAANRSLRRRLETVAAAATSRQCRDRKSTRLNFNHYCAYRMPSSA